jgi:hypothetical protein
MRLKTDIPHEKFHICWDVGHSTMKTAHYGDDLHPPAEFLPLVGHVHIHDVDMSTPNDHRPQGAVQEAVVCPPRAPTCSGSNLVHYQAACDEDSGCGSSVVRQQSCLGVGFCELVPGSRFFRAVNPSGCACPQGTCGCQTSSVVCTASERCGIINNTTAVCLPVVN